MTTSAKKVTNSNVDTNYPDSPISEKANKRLHQSVDNLTQSTSVTEEQLRQTAQTSVKKVLEKQRQAKEYWDRSAVGKYTSENPAATAGIAFVAGMLLTRVLRKK